MKNFISALVCCILLLAGCSSIAVSPRETADFNDGWTFHLGDIPQASSPDFDDSGWRRLNLPHDWAVEGDFSIEHPSGTGGGALPGGIGWYRKSFVPCAADSCKLWRLEFDGVYMNAEVFVNGESLGVRPYGYISFGYDITHLLRWGEVNVVAVRVDNAEQPNSRWYSGCGIYRDVRMVKTSPLHVAPYGVFVTAELPAGQSFQMNSRKQEIRGNVSSGTSDPSDSRKQEIRGNVSENHSDRTIAAKVTARTVVANGVDSDAVACVVSTVVDEAGKAVASAETEVTVAAASEAAVAQSLELQNPALWDVDDPYLYTMVTEIWQGDVLADRYETRFGVRTFAFDPDRGFILNGRKVTINGVCLHHDFGCLGAAFNVNAARRQLQILKDMGCNGIRTSHNPPAPQLLDLCDEMGFIVQDEAFDMWRKKKTAHDYSRYFNEWHERDLHDFVVRDRNHPSIFMWSIGNEVLEQWSHADADTLSLAEANLILNFGHSADMLAAEGSEMSVNSLLTRKLADFVRNLDPTRPITAGCNEPSPGNHLFRSGALDIIGFNYHNSDALKVQQNFPGMPFIITESNSALMTRGYYRMPSDQMFVWPERWDIPFHDDSFSCSSYENCHVPWGNTHEETIRLIRDNDYISGQYIWTGFDYIGEPTPYGWPARSSFFGIVDLAGFPKDVYYLYQSEWTDTPVLHLFPHWNWEEGQEVDLWCYFNNADEVELYVNGVSQGVRRKTDDCLHAVWRVVYQPGELEVIAYKDASDPDGAPARVEVARKSVRTAGEPAQVRLTLDRYGETAAEDALAFVTVEILDAEGNLYPDADNLVDFSLAGDSAFIAGVDNGNPVSMERFKDSRRKAFNGRCLVVLQASSAGKTVLTATSEGLMSDSVTFRTK